MRSVKDIMRTYIHVNRDGGPKHPVRFGSLFALAAAALIALVLAAGSGPAPLSQDAPGDHTGATGQGAGAGEGADGPSDVWDEDAAHALDPVQRELPGGGMYFGYAPERYDPADRDAYDASAAAHRAMAYHMDHAGMAPPTPVTRDGVVLGYEVRPIG